MTSIARRLLILLVLLVGIFAASRGIIRALPGDPLETLTAETGTSVPKQQLKEQLRLDRPFTAAVVQDLGAALKGDFGQSLLTQQPIGPLLGARLLNTAELTLLALLLAIPLSLLIGLSAADRPGSWIDRFCSLHGVLCAAFPTPWIGPLLILTLAVWIPLFPIGGSIALPALTLAIVFSGLWARLIRERVRESLRFGSANGARARGIPEWRVLFKYGLTPVSGPLLAYLGLQLGHLLTGAFVTEIIFDWRGLGQLLISAILRRDYPVVEAATFVTACLCLLGIWLGDWLQARVNPWRH